MVPTTQLTTVQSVATPKTKMCMCHGRNPHAQHETFNFQLATNKIKSENGESHPMPRYSSGGSVTPHVPCADVPCGGVFRLGSIVATPQHIQHICLFCTPGQGYTTHSSV
jgi:hypothetical protein